MLIFSGNHLKKLIFWCINATKIFLFRLFPWKCYQQVWTIFWTTLQATVLHNLRLSFTTRYLLLKKAVLKSVLLNYRKVLAHVYDKIVPVLFENRINLILLKNCKELVTIASHDNRKYITTILNIDSGEFFQRWDQ